MHTVVTLTMNPSIDKSTSVDNVIPEKKLRCSTPRYDPGGGGINVSRAIAYLGGQSEAIFPAGGGTGQMLRELLVAEGIACRPISVGGRTRENLHVITESTGQQYRFNMPGPELTEHEWRSCLEALALCGSTPSYIIGSGTLPPGVPVDFFARAARFAADLGARFVLDTSGDALAAAASEPIYLLKPNIKELGQLAGRTIAGESDLEEAARQIMAKACCAAVVVSLGPAGAVLVTPQKALRFHAPAVQAVSRVGAGDSMVAGIVLSLARGRSLVDSVRFGLAAGTAAVLRDGTQLCRREDAERLYERMPPAEYAGFAAESLAEILT